MVGCCRVCGIALTPKQTVVCSPKCRAKGHRQARAEWERRVRGLLGQIQGLAEEAGRLVGHGKNRA